jgi:hypothetical protein
MPARLLIIPKRQDVTVVFQYQQGDGPDADALADFGQMFQMFVDGLDPDYRHDQRGASAGNPTSRHSGQKPTNVPERRLAVEVVDSVPASYTNYLIKDIIR